MRGMRLHALRIRVEPCLPIPCVPPKNLTVT
jgi:hypothetical protein